MNFFQSNKSLILSFVSILLALFLIFVMAGSNRLKDFLNDSMSDSIVSRPYREMQTILPEWINFLSNSAFWIEAGDFSENFEDSNLNLLNRAVSGSLPGVAAINYRSGMKYHSFILEEGRFILREINGNEEIRQIPLEMKDLPEDSKSNSDTIFLSNIHSLISTGEPGFSVTLEMPSASGKTISLDISLLRFIEFYKDIFDEDGILFSSFSKSEFITIPLNSAPLKGWSGSLGEKGSENYNYYYDLTKHVLEEISSSEMENLYHIEYDEQKWFVLLYELNEYGSSIGFILPESDLFFSQFDRFYVLAAIPFFLLFLVLIILFFLGNYRERRRLSEEELLLQVIEKGESKKLEFKSSLRWDYRDNCVNKKLEEVIMKSIAAFGNSAGGDLLIGVSDDGKPLGLQQDYQSLKHPDRDTFELHLRNLASAMYGTFVSRNVDVKFIEVHGKDICQVSVRSSSQPLFTTMTSKSGGKNEQFYIRDGNMSRRIESLKDITVYCQKRFK
ncbi:ATP-binding protein [Oceanispirochaeta crateris]|uniref:ATP-binding protein n=1 Tax=Oceanispirochaeta crateris TaxID=2518645 RepID=A0A5C1QLB2_9SPIO|nr:ATP-binding protein [Oceanispirochaeta crateris]QEN08955.1 ATP-binding protein [Oceanispirochaeta crateris]